MFNLEKAILSAIFPIIPGSFLLIITTLGLFVLPSFIEGKLTEFTMVPFSKKFDTCSAAIRAQFTSASFVLAPKCGIKITSPCIEALSISSGVGKSVTYLEMC